MQRGYEIAQDPTEWDVEQKDVRQAKEDAANQVDELEDDDEEADVSTSKRKKATKEKSKKKAKVSKVSFVDLTLDSRNHERARNWGGCGFEVN